MLDKIRLFLAVAACKAAIWGSRLLGKKGSSAPGQLALAIYPGVLKSLAAQVKREIIVVCGTNGKTTTNNLLYSFLSSRGFRVVCNKVGANMLYGVCCAFAQEASVFGRLRADYACIEVDEASCVKVFAHMKPDKMVITNLFRDQLDRYGEIDITVDYLKRALALTPETELILNGDDPLVAQFGENTERKCYYMGVDEDAGVSLSETKEGRFCVLCGEKLEYEYYHYSQLGKFHCPGCGFARRPLDFRVSGVSLDNGLKFQLEHEEKSIAFDVSYRGFYNIYNIVLSYAAATLAAGEIPDYAGVLARYRPQIGRMEEFCVGKKIVLNLSKNPAGFNQAISTVAKDERPKDVLIVINDNAQDGKDISWIWDVDFERMKEIGIGNFILSGIRVDDLAVRLKYAGIEEERLTKVRSLREAAQTLAAGGGEIGYALVNYTAVFRMQDILKELEKEAGNNE